MMRYFALALLVGLLPLTAGLMGCGETNPDRSYTGTARYRYQQGMEAFEDSDYLEATNHFTFVKNKFAYSKYAALAELRVADVLYKQEKYMEAAEGYRFFMRSRPNHREVAFAMWRVAQCFYEELPSDFVLFPPAHEKDQVVTQDAYQAFQRYLKRFPNGEHAVEAKERARTCRAALADHEIYVAHFYLKQDRPVSARGRLEKVLKVYPELAARWARTAWTLVGVYAELKLNAEAIATARLLVEKQPTSDEAGLARHFLSGL